MIWCLKYLVRITSVECEERSLEIHTYFPMQGKPKIKGLDLERTFSLRSWNSLLCRLILAQSFGKREFTQGLCSLSFERCLVNISQTYRYLTVDGSEHYAISLSKILDRGEGNFSKVGI